MKPLVYRGVTKKRLASCDDDFRDRLGLMRLYPESPLDGEVVIYALLEPRVPSDVVHSMRYVGFTADPEQRYHAHLYQLNGRTPKERWIQEVIDDGQLPIMVELSRAVVADAECSEIAAIAEMRAVGAPLLNDTIGGRGTKGHVITQETRSKISHNSLGTRSIDPNGRRHRPVSKTQRHTVESKAKIVAANKGEANHAAKLTWDQVCEIRRRLTHGEIGVDIAREYGIGTTQLSRIRRNLVWVEDK